MRTLQHMKIICKTYVKHIFNICKSYDFALFQKTAKNAKTLMLTNVKIMTVRAQFSLARMLKYVNFKVKDLKMNVLIFKSKKSYVNHMSIICCYKIASYV